MIRRTSPKVAHGAVAATAVEQPSQRRSSNWTRYLLRPLLVIIFITFLLIALLALLLSFASPYVGRYQSEIQARVSD